MQYKAVLLDLDGTLVNSIPDIAAATNQMLGALGRPEQSLELITSFVGKGTDVLVQRALRHGQSQTELDDTLSQQARTLFAQYYARSNGQQSSLYDGVIEGLTAFKAMGYKLAVVTNKTI